MEMKEDECGLHATTPQPSYNNNYYYYYYYYYYYH